MKFSIYVYKVFLVLDVEKQLGVEKDSLGTLRKQIEEAQKQSGKIIQPAVKLQKKRAPPLSVTLRCSLMTVLMCKNQTLKSQTLNPNVFFSNFVCPGINYD